MTANRVPIRPLITVFVLIVAAAAVIRGLPTGHAAEPPAHLLRYLEGLDALTAERWSDATKIFEEVERAAGSDPRPVLAKGVALVMQGQVEPAVAAFGEAARRGYPGREPQLWGYVAERMVNGVLGSGDFTDAPRGPGNVAWFSGIPGHMIQGRDDYPTDYASFLYYEMATPYGDAAENGARTDTPPIRAQFRAGARWFANRARAAPDLALPLYRRAEAQDNAGDFRGALANLQIVRVSYPDDWLVAALASDCWLGLSRPATARREATLALVNTPDSAYSFVRRAVAGARLGRVEQARADLKLARTYNEAEVKNDVAVIERTIAEVEKAGNPAALRQQLADLAARGAADAELERTALALVRAVEPGRRYYDEFYTAKIRAWHDQTRQRPKDPGPLAGLAGFIVDEANTARRGEALEPGRATAPDRAAAGDERDCRRAVQLADAALALDPKFVPALIQKARALARLGSGDDAERLVAQALTIAPRDPAALRMQGRFWIERANAMLMQAATLRTPIVTTNTWTETRSDGIYEVTRTTTRPPSASDLASADQLERGANGLLSRARVTIDAALAASKGTLEGDLLAADVAFSRGDLAGAEAAARAALKRDPNCVAAYDILADVHFRAGRGWQADEARSAGANLMHSTAGWKLHTAWKLIDAREFENAARALDEATQLDPADGRIDALRGEIARLTRKPDDARTSWRMALALASARIALDEQAAPAANPPVPRDPQEFGLALAVRQRLAADAAAPDEALKLCQASAAAEAFLPPGGLAVQMFSAMLPDPDAPPIPARVPDVMAEWLVRAHVGVARVHLQAKRATEALAAYRAAARYAAPGGNAMIPNVGTLRDGRLETNFARYAKGPEMGEALIALARDAIRRRDFPAASVYLGQAGETRIPQAQRQELNQMQFEIARGMQGG